MRSSIVVRSEAARIRRSREAFAAAGPCDSTSRTRVSAATSDRVMEWASTTATTSSRSWRSAAWPGNAAASSSSGIALTPEW